MKLRSGRRLSSSVAPRSCGPGGGADRISDLPDDLLLLILGRLGCVRSAARAGVLSRRWRGLWTRLPSLVFRGVAFRSLEPALANVVSLTLQGRTQSHIRQLLRNGYGASSPWTQNKARQIEQHLWMEIAADLSVMDLELHLTTLGHVYGAVVFFFLKMHRIRTAIHRLKLRVSLLDPDTISANEEECRQHCACAPTNWTSQVVSLMELAEVEIDGFQGDDHEFDVLEHLFRCAPTIKKMVLKQSYEVAPSATKVRDFFEAHPFVECYYISSSHSAPKPN
ncbi:F-box/FBD/LRR-repeat protein At5g53840-like [Triticum aestivum]|uniref:F-box/FBD/LRR-repeat protein At5g53840-like n=1 Tax=Triticum aestivum TaxID=4565 RepID=UPI001D006E83|nr:F-box/FBD/LRR-repeat protein At5g53840-like [Triticum aestivum]